MPPRPARRRPDPSVRSGDGSRARPPQPSALLLPDGPAALDDRTHASRGSSRGVSPLRQPIAAPTREAFVMLPATAKAPTLAWLLTALTCLVVGMAIVESRHQVVALPVTPPVGVEVTVRVAFEP